MQMEYKYLHKHWRSAKKAAVLPRPRPECSPWVRDELRACVSKRCLSIGIDFSDSFCYLSYSNEGGGVKLLLFVFCEIIVSEQILADRAHPSENIGN